MNVTLNKFNMHSYLKSPSNLMTLESSSWSFDISLEASHSFCSSRLLYGCHVRPEINLINLEFPWKSLTGGYIWKLKNESPKKFFYYWQKNDAKVVFMCKAATLMFFCFLDFFETLGSWEKWQSLRKTFFSLFYKINDAKMVFM